MHLSLVCPRMGVGGGGGGSGNPGELDFIKRTWVGILTSTTFPGVGNLTWPPSWKVERILEWVTSDAPSWKIPRIHLSEFPVSKDGWTKGNEGSIALFFKQKCCFYAHRCSVFKVLNIIYFSFNSEKRHSYKSSIRSKFTFFLHALTRFRPFNIRYVYRFASTLQMSN